MVVMVLISITKMIIGIEMMMKIINKTKHIVR